MIDYKYSIVVFAKIFIITKNKILWTMKRCRSNSVFDSNNILNKIFKILIDKFLSIFVLFFQIAVLFDHHSKCFCEIHISAIKKFNKKNYIVTRTYRSIFFFNILNKILKSIIIKRISALIETHDMLFELQIKMKKQRFCETTLKLFIEQIHTIWNIKHNKIITLLNMNVVEIFNHVSKKN